MQKWTAFVFAALAVAAVAVIVTQRPDKGGGAPTVIAEMAPDARHDGGYPQTPGRDGGPQTPGSLASLGLKLDAGALSQGVERGDGGDLAANPGENGAGPDSPFGAMGGSDAGATLLNGAAPPSLAGDAPKSVVFGVILVQYKGAQGAPASARSRDDALEHARQIAADAKTDFKAAVAKGDSGSMENAGRMPRGMLEPAPEFVLFSLPKDGVSDPVETPRGFWIVHRIE